MPFPPPPSSPRSPATKYTPWFKTVLKAARVAIFTLGLLDGEARASRLSFADVVRRIAEQPETAPSFISKKVTGGLKQGGGGRSVISKKVGGDWRAGLLGRAASPPLLATVGKRVNLHPCFPTPPFTLPLPPPARAG